MNIIPPNASSVILILGGRGYGKTALSHRLLELFHEKTERDIYIMGYPEDKTELLPDWINWLPPETQPKSFPDKSTLLIHEAHHLLHAREHMDTENIEKDKLVTISRHKDMNIIFETQQSSRLDKNFVMSVDVIIYRYPQLLQESFKRTQLKKLTKDAKNCLDKYVNRNEEKDDKGNVKYIYVEETDEIKKHAWIHSGRFRGEYPYKIDLPEHWSEEISKAYGKLEEDKTQEEKQKSKIRQVMQEDNQYKQILEEAIKKDRQCSKKNRIGFKASDVKAAGPQMNKLVRKNVMEITSKGETKRYRLSNRKKVEEVLEPQSTDEENEEIEERIDLPKITEKVLKWLPEYIEISGNNEIIISDLEDYLGLSKRELDKALTIIRDHYFLFPYILEKHSKKKWKAKPNEEWEEKKNRVKEVLQEGSDKIDLQKLLDENRIGEQRSEGELNISKDEFSSVLQYLSQREHIEVEKDKSDVWIIKKDLDRVRRKIGKIRDEIDEETEFKFRKIDFHIDVGIPSLSSTNRYRIHHNEMEYPKGSKEDYIEVINGIIKDII